MNLVVLVGELASPLDARSIASGATVVSFDLRTEPGVTVPAAWTDPPATVPSWPPGTRLAMIGSVRRRFFRAGGATQSRTEVLATSVGRADRRRLARVIGDAQALLGQPDRAS